MNSRGLRGTREYAELPPSGARRILACGESFTFGEEVADGETWCVRLEALVPQGEVLNYGVGGYGTDQELLAGGERFWQPLLAALDERGIEWLDASEPLVAEARTSGAGALYRESHFSPLGNEVVARALAARLAPPDEASR